MEERRQGIVLRASSEYKSSVTLLDEHYGKIEGIVYGMKSQSQQSARLFNGALISYLPKKKHAKFTILDIQLVDMPSYWTGEHFLFFHHILELSDYFLPWDAQATALFRLLHVLYTDPEAVGTKRAQKVFLSHFFRRLGIYPEEGSVPAEKGSTESWLRACVNAHPRASSLNTASFLNTVGLNEESA